MIKPDIYPTAENPLVEGWRAFYTRSDIETDYIAYTTTKEYSPNEPTNGLYSSKLLALKALREQFLPELDQEIADLEMEAEHLARKLE